MCHWFPVEGSSDSPFGEKSMTTFNMPRILRQIRENRAGIPTTTTMGFCSKGELQGSLPLRWHTSKGRQAVASQLASHSSFWRRIASFFFSYDCLISGSSWRIQFLVLECLFFLTVKVPCCAGCPGERRGDPHGGDATQENGCSHVRAPSSCAIGRIQIPTVLR